MNNLFPAHRNIHETYDLKDGTIVAREQAGGKSRGSDEGSQPDTKGTSTRDQGLHSVRRGNKENTRGNTLKVFKVSWTLDMLETFTDYSWRGWRDINEEPPQTKLASLDKYHYCSRRMRTYMRHQIPSGGPSLR
jgi:hypothetical protein